VLLGQLAAGSNPNAPASERAGSGPTLREGVDTHLAKMKKKGRSPRSIQTFTHETNKYLTDWLDRPFSELTGATLIELHQQIKDQAAKRTGTNPANDKGAPLANRVIAHVSASWRSLNKKLEGKLGNWNPASAVDRDIIRPSRERIQDEDLPDYAARVAPMRSPIKRDGLMMALYTGLRSEDVRTMRGSIRPTPVSFCSFCTRRTGSNGVNSGVDAALPRGRTRGTAALPLCGGQPSNIGEEVVCRKPVVERVREPYRASVPQHPSPRILIGTDFDAVIAVFKPSHIECGERTIVI
jgi:hypothetical protein